MKLLSLLLFLFSIPTFAAPICVLDSSVDRFESPNTDWEFDSPDVLASGYKLESVSKKLVQVTFHSGEYRDQYTLDYICKRKTADIRICSNGKREDRDDFGIQLVDGDYKVYQVLTKSRKKTVNAEVYGIFRCPKQ